jgi:hypothetical protein
MSLRVVQIAPGDLVEPATKGLSRSSMALDPLGHHANIARMMFKIAVLQF